MAKKQPKLTDQLRQALRDCGESRYAIHKTTGIHQTVLWRFIHGGSMSLANLDLLAEHLGAELKIPRRKRSK